MNLLRSFTRPYYVHRPSQIWRRLKFEFQKSSLTRLVELPWGLRMRANPGDDLGHALLTVGINDLMVSECLFRLTDPGETAVDVGANVGYTTSILCTRAGPSGRVFSFEPHPVLHQELRHHLDAWKTQRKPLAEVTIIHRAVSDQAGEAVLNEPGSFEANKGRSSLEARPDSTDDGRELRVMTVSLDEQFADAKKIDVLKVDVEGHEQQVFRGAKDLLSSGRVRDVLFEEFAPYPAETHRTLEQAGFHLFVVAERLAGPVLVAPSADWKPPVHSPPNYVGTRDLERLRRKFAQRGWQCLSAKV